MGSKLEFDLMLGVQQGSQVLKHVKLLRTNGVVEQVFMRKDSQYNWAARVIAICVGSIDDVEIGAAYRKAYLDNEESAMIPQIVKNLSLQEANRILIEIHRRLWKDVLKNQINLCTGCAKEFLTDIDLFKLDYTEQDKKLIEGVSNPFDWFTMEIDLIDGFELSPIKGSDEFTEFNGMLVSKLIFKTPTLGDAMLQEDATDDIDLWRGIAYTCLTAMYAKPSEDSTDVIEVPTQIKGLYNRDRLFGSDFGLTARDLSRVRAVLRDSLPSMPFEYTDTCPCPKKRLIHYAVPLGSFFGD